MLKSPARAVFPVPAIALFAALAPHVRGDEGEWVKMFDGKTLDGWKVNEKTLVDYTEPEGQEAFSKEFERRLGEGTIALQAHDPKSLVYFKNLQIKRLP